MNLILRGIMHYLWALTALSCDVLSLKEEGHFCLVPSVDRPSGPNRPSHSCSHSFFIDAKRESIFQVKYICFQNFWFNADCNILILCHLLLAIYHIFIYWGKIFTCIFIWYLCLFTLLKWSNLSSSKLIRMLAKGFLILIISFDEINTLMLLCTLTILVQSFKAQFIITDDVDGQKCKYG